MSLGSILLGEQSAAAVWLLCGPPASGKSTFRHHWWSGPVISPDDLRAAMFGVEYHARGEGLVWSRATAQAKRLLRSGETVLIDATNVSRSARARWIRTARTFGVDACAISCWDPVQTPLEELLRRNRQRARVVPEENLRKTAAAWETPSLAEGLRAVYTVIAMSE